MNMGWSGMTPGTYRVRLRYTGKRDATVWGYPSRPKDLGPEEWLKTVWEGTATSNWITVVIAPRP